MLGDVEQTEQGDNANVQGIAVISRLTGASRSLLMLASGLKLWVIKFQDNPQHPRLVLTEYIATEIARSLGLSVPPCKFVGVPQSALDRNLSGVNLDPRYHRPGLHFGSKFTAQRDSMKPVHFFPSQDLPRVSNLAEVTGIYALDVWLGNTDSRQVVFVPNRSATAFQAWWIDFGECFGGGGGWENRNWNPCCMLQTRQMYTAFNDVKKLARWVERIQSFPTHRLTDIIMSIPAVLRDPEMPALEMLVSRLDERRSEIAELIVAAVATTRETRRHCRHEEWDQVGFTPSLVKGAIQAYTDPL